MLSCQRIHRRLLAQHLGFTSVTLDGKEPRNPTLLDISAGGLRFLFENEVPYVALRVGDEIQGIIESKDVPFNLRFAGKVVWLKRVSLVGEPATMLGMAFDDYAALPDVLLQRIEHYGQGD